MLFDVFISHASEDKDAVARPLAEQLRESHVEVWYDEFTLNVGDSLRRSIDRGLAQCRYGIVVLSPAFFNKKWSQWELDGLVARQNAGDAELLLPVWHQVSRDEVIAFSPPLADRFAVNSSEGTAAMVERLLAVLQPQGSTLAIARDHLIDRGWDPPVISDDYWLDVAAFAESNEMEGGWQEAMGWGRWGFPLPPWSKEPHARGWRMARAAMQMSWQDEAEAIPITQVTPPDEVHAFIESHSDLAEVCEENLHYLITYAPQLTIPGFGGRFEEAIEDYYKLSIERAAAYAAESSSFGTALTTDGKSPRCDEDLALHDPNFGGYEPAMLACSYVQGSGVANGPPVMFFQHIDYVAWLFSTRSDWLPAPIRDVLTQGMAEWAVWPWHEGDRRAELAGFRSTFSTGMLSTELSKRKSLEKFKFSDAIRADAAERLSFSASLLGLPESGEELAAKLLSPSFLGAYFAEKKRRSK